MNGTEQYVSFFHGRHDPDEDMDTWGEAGPIVGPIQVSWTYGTVKFHQPPEWDDFHFLISHGKSNDLIPIGDMYYGDFEIWNNNDPLIESGRNEGRQFLTLEEFKKLNKQIK